MPPKLDPDESSKFLYVCLKNSDYSTIDWTAVGAVLDIKANAARMRFSRLSNSIDSQMAAGNDKTPSTTPTMTPTATPKTTPKKPSTKKTPTKQTPTKRKKETAVSDGKSSKKAKVEEGVEDNVEEHVEHVEHVEEHVEEGEESGVEDVEGANDNEVV